MPPDYHAGNLLGLSTVLKAQIVTVNRLTPSHARSQLIAIAQQGERITAEAQRILRDVGAE